MWTSKYSGSRVIVAKIADIGPTRAPQYFFQKKNLERSNYCTPRLTRIQPKKLAQPKKNSTDISAVSACFSISANNIHIRKDV